ncbi:hypothetical protein BO86DRAFT_389332 [Aspergillus japonicus CBS 114.51]|uniref:Uncharacterized protein n=1 Tax=Aspergillus japonicus CBS 114.51 TaxID=1448312 RepID=A0A8T8X2I5_ASPJA|nr:hypothetical protein BO86DRAFT_389332 [Aspergillus japonicus CBS 114.51]RAH81842.1 hypothetical protein BO86DRAFT_389332 [Aspergillus japonicus CBS 114.51]
MRCHVECQCFGGLAFVATFWRHQEIKLENRYPIPDFFWELFKSAHRDLKLKS